MFLQAGPSPIYPQYSIWVGWSQGAGGQTSAMVAVIDPSLTSEDQDLIAAAIRDAIADFVSSKTVTATQIVRADETLTEL